MSMSLVSIVARISHLAPLIKKTTVFSDRTEYSAYAERCCDKTVIVNRKNARAENVLTSNMVAGMNFREFAETVSDEWHKDAGAGTEPTDEPTGRRIMTRDIHSGHWVLKWRAKRRHIRFSTVLYTDAHASTSRWRTEKQWHRHHFSAFP